MLYTENPQSDSNIQIKDDIRLACKHPGDAFSPRTPEMALRAISQPISNRDCAMLPQQRPFCIPSLFTHIERHNSVMTPPHGVILDSKPALRKYKWSDECDRVALETSLT